MSDVEDKVKNEAKERKEADTSAWVLAGGLQRGLWTRNCFLSEIRVRNRGHDYQLILKMVDADMGKKVAFYNAKSVASACAKIRKDYFKEELNWKVDKPYNP